MRCRPTAPSVFSPLSNFAALEELSVYGKSFVGLDDGNLEAIADSCPSLRQVRLDPEHKSLQDLAYATILTLGHILECCSLLNRLTLPLGVNSLQVHELLRRAEKNLFHRPPFHSLAVVRSPIPNPNDVYPMAALLSLWAPGLREIYCVHGGDANWEVVWRLQKAFKSVRRQERRWKLGQAKGKAN